MKTSEVRKAALRIAVDLYESTSGDLVLRKLDLVPAAAAAGINDPVDVASIENYLTSTGVMQHGSIGMSWMRFTPAGIAAVEAGLDRPDQSHAPFPPMSIVFGDIHAGAQVAVGNGTFNQSRDGGGDLSEVVRLAQAAAHDWPADRRREVAGAEAALIAEASAAAPDPALVRPAVAKLLGIAERVATGTATQALLAYCKAHGWMQ